MTLSGIMGSLARKPEPIRASVKVDHMDQKDGWTIEHGFLKFKMIPAFNAFIIVNLGANQYTFRGDGDKKEFRLS